MKFLVSIHILLSILFFSCSHSKPASKNNSPQTDIISNDTSVVKDVTISSLLAKPQLYNYSKVRVEGYLHIQFEGNSIYTNKEDRKNWADRKGLWVDFVSREKMNSFRKFSDHYVIIQGTFNANKHGHMDTYGGEIDKITRISLKPEY
jgi:hypothetical protein